jgi:hypothetical protein
MHQSRDVNASCSLPPIRMQRSRETRPWRSCCEHPARLLLREVRDLNEALLGVGIARSPKNMRLSLYQRCDNTCSAAPFIDLTISIFREVVVGYLPGRCARTSCS